MNDYGFGAAMETALELYDRGARASGRTERLIEVLADRDIVVMLDDASGRHLKQRIRQSGKNVRIITCEPTASVVCLLTEELRGNRAHFCHCWIKKYFSNSIRVAQRDLLACHASIVPQRTVASPNLTGKLTDTS